VSYSDKLKHPFWQKKRLEILERDNWKCRICQTKDKTLHVHHGYYEKDKNPWDYPNESLSVLCDDCHNDIHKLLNRMKKYIGLIPPEFYNHLHSDIVYKYQLIKEVVWNE